MRFSQFFLMSDIKEELFSANARSNKTFESHTCVGYTREIARSERSEKRHSMDQRYASANLANALPSQSQAPQAPTLACICIRLDV